MSDSCNMRVKGNQEMETPKNEKFCPEEDVIRRISRNVTRHVQGLVWDELQGTITPFHDIIMAEVKCEKARIEESLRKLRCAEEFLERVL